jgi:hypothetical protein
MQVGIFDDIDGPALAKMDRAGAPVVALAAAS